MIRHRDLIARPKGRDLPHDRQFDVWARLEDEPFRFLNSKNLLFGCAHKKRELARGQRE